MKFIMFTKHLEGLEIPEIITALQSVGVSGADLCVRPGYPVNPENATEALPAAAKQFADAGLSIPLVTTPGDFLDPTQEETRRVYAAAGEAGVEYIKLGYWHWHAEDGGYWAQVDAIRKQLEGFAKLSEQYGPRTCIHNHSGTSMGLNSCAVMNLVKDFNPTTRRCLCRHRSFVNCRGTDQHGTRYRQIAPCAHRFQRFSTDTRGARRQSRPNGERFRRLGNDSSDITEHRFFGSHQFPQRIQRRTRGHRHRSRSCRCPLHYRFIREVTQVATNKFWMFPRCFSSIFLTP